MPGLASALKRALASAAASVLAVGGAVLGATAASAASFPQVINCNFGGPGTPCVQVSDATPAGGNPHPSSTTADTTTLDFPRWNNFHSAVISAYHTAILGSTNQDQINSPVFTVPKVTQYCWNGGVVSLGYFVNDNQWEWNGYALRTTLQFVGSTSGATSGLLMTVHDVTTGSTTTNLVATSGDGSTRELQTNLFPWQGDQVWISYEMDPSRPANGWYSLSTPELISYTAYDVTGDHTGLTYDPCDYPGKANAWPRQGQAGAEPPDPSHIANGGFESDITGWKGGAGQPNPIGLYGVTTTKPHFGTYSAILGDPATASGTSHIGQAFLADSTDHTLSLWYDNVCPDSVTYDYAEVVLTDLVTSSTTPVLPKTCRPNTGWVQITAAITPGHRYLLDLYNVDDHNANDPTYTQFDDVTTW